MGKPVAFIVGAAAVAFINDDEVKEVRGIFAFVFDGVGAGSALLEQVEVGEELAPDEAGQIVAGRGEALLWSIWPSLFLGAAQVSRRKVGKECRARWSQ